MYGEDQVAGQCTQESMGILKAAVGRYIPPTKRQKLEQAKQQLEAALDKINVAIAALDAHPDLEQFMNVIESAGV